MLASAARWLRTHAFTPSATGAAERIGVEAEWIPVRADGRPAPIITPDGRGTVNALRRVAAQRGWSESTSTKSGVSEFISPDRDRVTFEPGGQIEFAAAPAASPGAVTSSVRSFGSTLADACGEFGYRLCTMGLDPFTPIEAAPLQLHAERYRRMDEHFARIGPDGARMMRQTASLQITLETGEQPEERWKLLQALTPYLAGIFANAPLQNGIGTGWSSMRRSIWDAVDPSRTGLVIGEPDDDVATAYARFALGADAFLIGAAGEPARPLAHWGERAAPGTAAWAEHLTTLFPEVRARGYFEVRTCDAIPEEFCAAPLVFLTGLVCSVPAAHEAAALLRVGEVPPDPAMLSRAGRCGMRDADLRATAGELWALALEGAARLGTTIADEVALATAHDFVARYTARGLTPADDAIAALSAQEPSGLAQ
ncbi:MAG TPA: glutamate-cysteine ligase family protein [Gemmatimonadaceae bacterium]|nr:glutamate-cysteine ligase family protein [Gemmatimonadaceae bacterium]